MSGILHGMMNKNSSRVSSSREAEDSRDGRGDCGSPAFKSLPPLNVQPPTTPATVRQMAPTGLLSPLKIFGQAKRKINEIFVDMGSYSRETHPFLEELKVLKPEVLPTESADCIADYAGKINGINEVLARDHMKVAFFGRTSNGKSTVINAMLHSKILPSGIGHTTSCFLQVEGSDDPEPCLYIEETGETLPVESVASLAHALCREKLKEESLVSVRWPKEKCPLLKDDVVFVDSPGIDVSPDLDTWIDKHCLDADVFILVGNSESTLMQAEKNFFHKVNQKLSKPNIFILNNRWDASANEPETMEMVRSQHLERSISFLTDELQVVSKYEAEDRVFFVSAKEALISRTKESGTPSPHGILQEGHQARFFEFSNFERKFEECISKSAVKTKFAKHTDQGKAIISTLCKLMEEVLRNSSAIQSQSELVRKEQMDRLDFMEKQLSMLTREMKDKIRAMVEDVERQVAHSLNDEIRRLSILVDEFDRPFHPDPLVLAVYKKELHQWVEQGLGRNLSNRCNTALLQSLQATQEEMTCRLSVLLTQEKVLQIQNDGLPKRDFEILYRTDCHNLCADFQEDIGFRFSIGIPALVNRILGPRRRKLAGLFGFGPESIPRPFPPSTPQTPSNERSHDDDNEAMMMMLMSGFVSLTSRWTVGSLVVSGIVWRAVGWRIIAFAASLYFGIYLYERLTWTNKAKERAFKKQYVQYASSKLRLIVDLTSSNCSHQVQQELVATLHRLCHQAEISKAELEEALTLLNQDINKLEDIGNKAKVLRNKGQWLDSELNVFLENFLKQM